MNDYKKNKRQSQFIGNLQSKAKRKIRARESSGDLWFGLGMMGLVGWSVVVPTLLGTAIGAWLDKGNSGVRSWTLILLISGLCLGCFNAWHWVSKQHRDIEDELDEEK